MTRYEKALEQWKDSQFSALGGNGSEEFWLDVDRFLAKYFLDGLTGRPDRSKTRNSLVMQRFFSPLKKLAEATDRVPGLEFRYSDRFNLAIVGWESDVEIAMEREFCRLPAPVPQRELLATFSVEFSVPLFFKKYFGVHVANGIFVASTERPSAPVVLYPAFFKDPFFLDQVISHIPGLHVRQIERGRDSRLWNENRPAPTHMVIGWDLGKVEEEILHIKAKRRRHQEEVRAERLAAKEEAAAEERARWHKICEPYRQFIAEQPRRSGPMSLEDLPGSYIIQWDGEGKELSYPYNALHALKLDIFPAKNGAHGLKASFDFSLFEGVMLLGLSRRLVEQCRQEQPKDDSDEENDEEDDEALSTAVSHKPVLAGQKRTLGDVAAPWGVQAAMAKRQKIGDTPKHEPETNSRPNRVYLQCAFKDKEGYPNVDEDNENIGWLDFDASKFSAKGNVILSGWSSETQSFSIYKIADESKAKYEQEWYEFDGRRWGRW